MTVYVDDMKAKFGRMVMCHMWSDSLDELLAMADLIGVARKWLQQPPKASWVHFDIATSKRRLAVAAGAVETDRYAPLEHVLRLRIANGTPDEVKAAMRKLDQIAEIWRRDLSLTPNLIVSPSQLTLL